MARNLWWSWQPDTQRLFASIDPRMWEATRHNPIATMQLVAQERKEFVEADDAFAAHLSRVEKSLRDYLTSKTWFDGKYGRTKQSRPPLIAYFCAEFAVHECLPQYSGGLGVLAGDHVKSASDLGVPLVGIGLLYRNGYYTQELAADGSTRVIYPRLDFDCLPITDTGKTIQVPMGNGEITAKIWRQLVGRVQLVLLDTDVEENSSADRALTRHLYGGDREYRIQQEILLGIGGMIALDALGLQPTVFHLNEGHAAFAALERLRRLVKRGVPIDEAKADVSQSGVFTTHTPVPAGNDRFAPKLAMKYLGAIGREMKLSERELLALGREDPEDKREEFCMTVLALKLSARCNGVAALHGDTSRKMWTKVFGLENDSDRVPIGHVTNGVHSQTWLAPEIRPLYEKYLKPKWNGAGPTDDLWKRAGKIPADELWAVRRALRARLVGFIRARMLDQINRQHGSDQELLDAQQLFDDDALTIGFARRFATYKRAPLIFRNAKRIAKILGDEDRPVQIVFAGKAHPADRGGQEFLREIHQLARQKSFIGRVGVLEDYDMELGRVLTSGCDVWLNNPLRPLEASGTSGMKPPLHGGINCSILDGWWPEAFDRTNGWAIGEGTQLSDQNKQDARDANAVYRLLEEEIVPEFYERDRSGVPRAWVRRMVRSMRTICSTFSAARMVGEYCSRFYMPSHGVIGGVVRDR